MYFYQPWGRHGEDHESKTSLPYFKWNMEAVWPTIWTRIFYWKKRKIETVILLLEKRGPTARKLVFTTVNNREFYEMAIGKISFNSAWLSLQTHYYSWDSWTQLVFFYPDSWFVQNLRDFFPSFPWFPNIWTYNLLRTPTQKYGNCFTHYWWANNVIPPAGFRWYLYFGMAFCVVVTFI